MTDLTPQVQLVDLPVFADDHKVRDLVTLHPDYVGDKHDTVRVYEITKRPSRSSERNYVATPLDGSKGRRGPASCGSRTPVTQQPHERPQQPRASPSPTSGSSWTFSDPRPTPPEHGS